MSRLELCGIVGITDHSVPVLSKLSQLRLLDVTDTGITEAGARELKAALPAATVNH
jgi:hypothetical protein